MRVQAGAAVLAGGLFGSGVLGLAEAMFHLVSHGASDGWAPLYAVGLYGGIGLGLAVVPAVAWAAFGRFDDSRVANAWGHEIGVVSGIAPMAGFIGLYLGNKVVFAEQGVPLWAKGCLVMAVLCFAIFQLTVGVRLSKGRGGQNVARASGSVAAWLGLVLLTGAFALLWQSEDPRADLAVDKALPAALVDAPNVLLIAVDTLRADALGTYGGPSTPAFDGLAADGIVFEQARAHASWTRSSFASLFTSRLPSAHQADTKAASLSSDLVLVSEVVQGAGAVTANLANNINVTSTFGFNQGYDRFIYEAPDYPFGATETVFSLTFYKVVHKLAEKLGGRKTVSRYYQPAEVVFEDARTFMSSNAGRRWMLGVHLMEPHDPYFAHPLGDGSPADFNGEGFARAEVERPDLAQADALKALYAGEVQHLDQELGVFLNELRTSGVYDDLLIVLTSDHGEEFGEHGGFWHGTSLYGEQLRVPLLVKLPKNELAGQRVSWRAGLIDVAPTITSVLGLNADETWVGKDLIPDVRRDVAEAEVVAAKEKAARDTVSMLAERADAGIADDEQRTELAAARAHLARLKEVPAPCTTYAHPRDRLIVAEQDFEGNVLSLVESGGFTYHAANASNPRGLPTVQLFDVVADSSEQRDLIPAPKTVCGTPSVTRQRALEETLSAELERAATGAVEAVDVEMGAEEICRLCALGYLEGSQCEDC